MTIVYRGLAFFGLFSAGKEIGSNLLHPNQYPNLYTVFFLFLISATCATFWDLANKCEAQGKEPRK